MNAEQTPVPRLEQTSAMVRDKACADARAAEQRMAELTAALRGMVGFIDLMRARPFNSPEENEILDTNHRVVTARALLAKVRA